MRAEGDTNSHGGGAENTSSSGSRTVNGNLKKKKKFKINHEASTTPEGSSSKLNLGAAMEHVSSRFWTMGF